MLCASVEVDTAEVGLRLARESVSKSIKQFCANAKVLEDHQEASANLETCGELNFALLYSELWKLLISNSKVCPLPPYGPDGLIKFM